jgi:dolichol-phosphate mannosyltransferase
MAAILLLGGIQLMMLGVVGLYINVIFLNSKGRPDYIIRSVIAADGRNDPEGQAVVDRSQKSKT